RAPRRFIITRARKNIAPRLGLGRPVHQDLVDLPKADVFRMSAQEELEKGRATAGEAGKINNSHCFGHFPKDANLTISSIKFLTCSGDLNPPLGECRTARSSSEEPPPICPPVAGRGRGVGDVSAIPDDRTPEAGRTLFPSRRCRARPPGRCARGR